MVERLGVEELPARARPQLRTVSREAPEAQMAPNETGIPSQLQPEIDGIRDDLRRLRQDMMQGFSRQAPSDPTLLATIVSAFTGLGYALSARALLLLSLIGAFTLALVAVEQQSVMSLMVLVAYAAFAILPVVFLEVRKVR
jgi:hypothetical protein